MATTYEVTLKWNGARDAAEAVRAADRVQEALGRLEKPARIGGNQSQQARRVADEWQRMAAAADKAERRRLSLQQRAAASAEKAEQRLASQQQRGAERAAQMAARIAARSARIAEQERIRGARAFQQAEDAKRNAAFRRLMAQQRDEERFSRYRIRLQQKEYREAQRLAAARERMESKRFAGYGRTAAGGLGAGFGFMSGGIKGVIGAVGAAAVLGGKEAIDTAKLVENARLRLKAQLGTTEAANAEIKDAFRIAEKTIFDPEEVLDSLTKLSTYFKDADVRRYVMGAVSDFATVSGKGTEGLERSIKTITDIVSKGKLQQEELTGQLSELGLPAGKVYEALATMLDVKDKDEQKRTDKVVKLISKGNVRSDMAVQAITTVMRNLSGGGPAGEFAVKASDTLGGIISNIQGGLKTLFAMSDVDQWPALQSLKDLLRDVAGFFSVDSQAGRAFVDALKSGIQKDLVPVVERIHRGLKAITSDPGKLELIVRGITRITSWLADAAYAAGVLAAGFVGLWGAIAKADEVIMGFVERALTGLRDGLVTAGEFIMFGLADGIKRGAFAVYDAVTEVGGRILSSLKAKLGIASPSRRGMELGNFFGQGVAIGIAGGADGIARASAGLGSAAERGFSPRAQLGSGASGGGSGVLVSITNHYHIAEAPDPAQFAKDVGALMGSQVQTQVDRYMSRLVFQAGGA